MANKKTKKSKRDEEPEEETLDQDSAADDAEDEELFDSLDEGDAEDDDGGEDDDAEDDEVAEADEEDDEEEPEPPKKASAKKPAASKKPAPAKDEAPAPVAAAPEESELTPEEEYQAMKYIMGLDEEVPEHLVFDPEGYEEEEESRGVKPAALGKALLIGLAISLVPAIPVFAMHPMRDIQLVLRGEFREYKRAERQYKEEQFNREQVAKAERYGNLTIMGTPKYASIKLNGQTWYAQTSSQAWRDIQVNPGFSTFPNLKIKQKHVIEVSAPGFETKKLELTRGMWEGGKDLNDTAAFTLNASLTPNSLEAKAEFDARMSTDEEDYFGTVTINTVPQGARVLFNNTPLTDAEGKPLVTPVTFDKFYVKAEDKDGKKTDKLAETLVRVDSVLDEGHKIQLEFDGKPKYETALERQMWICEKLPEEKLKELKLPEDASPQKSCKYTYTLNFDFNNLESYIKSREDEKRRVEEENKKIQEEKKKQSGAALDEAAKKAVEDAKGK